MNVPDVIIQELFSTFALFFFLSPRLSTLYTFAMWNFIKIWL